MTSRRNVFEGYPIDDLDRMIRLTLWEEAARASPPSRTWGHVRALVKRPTVWKLIQLGLSKSCWAVRVQLSRIDAFLGASATSWTWPQNGWVDWRFDPVVTRLVDQYGLLLSLAF
jgi:hypothetical protein